MSTWIIDKDNTKKERKAPSATGRLRILTSFAAILTSLIFVLCLTSTIPAPVGYAAAFPGQNGKFVVTMSNNWDLNTFELYVITENASGKNLKRLTHNSAFDFYPAWSPDGKKIAFSRRSQDGNYDIHIMDANGKNQKNLTNMSPADEVVPSWSPDGQKLAVSSCPDGDFDFFAIEYNCLEIYVIDAADGTNQMRLTDDNGAEDYGPTWSPDGEKIAFGTNRDGNREIYVMDADGGNETNLTNHPADDGFFAPYWSPDGKKIAFTTDRDGNNEIYVMDADGSNQMRLTNNESSDGIPVWSADGQKIAFKTNRDDFNWEIYVMDADGSNQTRLTNTELQVRILDWQSLGNKKY